MSSLISILDIDLNYGLRTIFSNIGIAYDPGNSRWLLSQENIQELEKHKIKIIDDSKCVNNSHFPE